jgi:hypothetical protein
MILTLLPKIFFFLQRDFGIFAKNFRELKPKYKSLWNFILLSTTLSAAINISTGSNHNYIHDVWIASAASSSAVGIDLTTVHSNIFENIYTTNQGYPGLSVSTNSNANKFTNVYVYSASNAISEPGVSLTGSFNVFDNLRVYNSYDDNLQINNEGELNFFKNCVFSTNRYTGSHSVNLSSSNNRFYNCTLDGATSYDINAGNAIENYFIGCTLNGSTGDYTRTTSEDRPLAKNLIIAPSGSDPIMVGGGGIITVDSSADARSGKALKFTPSNTGAGVAHKVGTVKVPSTATDLTVSVYIKDDAGFNGNVFFMVAQDGCWISKTEQTPTTSYVKTSVVVPAASLTVGKYIDLYVWVIGSVGSVWADDFSAEQ